MRKLFLIGILILSGNILASGDNVARLTCPDHQFKCQQGTPECTMGYKLDNHWRVGNHQDVPGNYVLQSASYERAYDNGETNITWKAQCFYSNSQGVGNVLAISTGYIKRDNSPQAHYLDVDLSPPPNDGKQHCSWKYQGSNHYYLIYNCTENNDFLQDTKFIMTDFGGGK